MIDFWNSENNLRGSDFGYFGNFFTGDNGGPERRDLNSHNERVPVNTKDSVCIISY